MSIWNNKNVLNFILYISIFAILFAFYVEFILGHKPCNLCLFERIPYILSILILVLLSIFNRHERIAFLILSIIFILAFILSIYHVGIERGLISESSICKSSSGLKIEDKEQLLKELKKNTISCKDVTFKIFGFSLATINAIVSLAISLITIQKFKNYEKK